MNVDDHFMRVVTTSVKDVRSLRDVSCPVSFGSSEKVTTTVRLAELRT